MATGLVGKPNGVRIITGSEHYGMRKKEAFNLTHREFPSKFGGRQIMIIGQTTEQKFEIIQPQVKSAVKTRKPATKSAAAKLKTDLV